MTRLSLPQKWECRKNPIKELCQSLCPDGYRNDSSNNAQLPQSLLTYFLLAFGIVMTFSNIHAAEGILKYSSQQRLSSTHQQTVKNVFTTPKRFAVLIGINQFDDSEWSSLKYAVKDAHDMAAVLNDTRYGQFDEVITLTNPQETTRNSILKTIRDLSQYNISKQDTVIFYISTHGTLARDEKGDIKQYLVTRDTQFNQIPNSALDVSVVKQLISNLRSHKKVMVIASCHSGTGKSQLSNDLLAELSSLKAPFFVKPLENVSEAMVVLTASAWGEAAREDVVLENDVYTHFLIDGIKKHDRNSDGAVTVTEAHDYAKQQTYYITKGKQRPTMESVITGVDPVILSGEVVRSGKPVIYDYTQRYENMVVFVDGQKKGSLPLGIAVDPGEHHVELRTADGLKPVYNEAFTVKEGQQVPIPLLIHGYDQGISFKLGYQGFLEDSVDQSIAKPLVMFGFDYANHAYFSPQFGYRLDLFHGSDEQKLYVDQTTVTADVSQTTFGASLLYRSEVGEGMAIYGGPRLGALVLKRNLHVNNVNDEESTIPTVGGIAGLNFRYKKQVSLSAEAAINYANVQLGTTNTASLYYSLFGNLAVNF
ncbi:MAG: caspase family protein [Gammaproteobacteria bacterium]